MKLSALEQIGIKAVLTAEGRLRLEELGCSVNM